MKRREFLASIACLPIAAVVTPSATLTVYGTKQVTLNGVEIDWIDPVNGKRFEGCHWVPIEWTN